MRSGAIRMVLALYISLYRVVFAPLLAAYIYIYKVNFKIKTFTRDKKKGHYLMIKGSIQEEDIIIRDSAFLASFSVRSVQLLSPVQLFVIP